MPPIFNVMIPAVPCDLINIMLEIAHFDIIEVSEYYEQVFEMPPTDALTPSLERIGFETYYFIYNLGAFSILVVSFIVA